MRRGYCEVLEKGACVVLLRLPPLRQPVRVQNCVGQAAAVTKAARVVFQKDAPVHTRSDGNTYKNGFLGEKVDESKSLTRTT